MSQTTTALKVNPRAHTAGQGYILSKCEAGTLQKGPADPEYIEGLLERAVAAHAAATLIYTQLSDANGTIINAWESTRHCFEYLLATQGLRQIGGDSHLGPTEAVGAQFGDIMGVLFNELSDLRQRRHDVDYPTNCKPAATLAEAKKYLDSVSRLLKGAPKLAESLNLFLL